MDSMKTNDTPFFSVIVPLHNAAGWMRKGLDSIRAQTFKDYELILICDSCEDETEQIAREYSDNVIVGDWRSCGVSRNRGLEAAKGEWILFMDDDDWWNTDTAFADIYEGILGNGPDRFDVLAFNFVFQGRGIARQLPGYLYIAIWNKAWKRSFVGSTRFPEVPHSDDVGFANATHGRARIRYLNRVLYYYNYLRPGSISDMLRTGQLKTLEEMGLWP